MGTVCGSFVTHGLVTVPRAPSASENVYGYSADPDPLSRAEQLRAGSSPPTVTCAIAPTDRIRRGGRDGGTHPLLPPTSACRR